MGCRVASSTTVGWCGLRKAWSQNATARGVSRMGTPTAALNHCRSASRKFTTAMGALHSRAASTASWSKESSWSVSRIAYSASARSLAASVEGRAGTARRPWSHRPPWGWPAVYRQWSIRKIHQHGMAWAPPGRDGQARGRSAPMLHLATSARAHWGWQTLCPFLALLFPSASEAGGHRPPQAFMPLRVGPGGRARRRPVPAAPARSGPC